MTKSVWLAIATIMTAAGCKQSSTDQRLASIDSTLKAREPSRATGILKGWRLSEDTSEMDESKTVSLHLLADSTVRNSYDRKIWPTIIIRCKNKKTDLFINNETSTESEYGKDDAVTVRFRIDGAQAFSEVWGESTDDQALFSPRPITFAKRLKSATRLLYEFTPFSSAPQVVSFTVQGLSEHLPKVASACGWAM